ncbi:MAG: aminoglycoside phosphotransferase family protein [Microbacterium sp.]
MTRADLGLLDETSAIGWARDRGVVPADAPVAARALSGGISNIVLALSWPGGDAVIKQSLPELRVAQHWQFDRARVITERRAIDYLGTVIPGHVPRILAFDDDSFAFAMTMAPHGGEVWKSRLLAGQFDPAIAGAAGRTLAQIQVASRRDRRALTAFEDRMPLVQGRIEPYHHAAAERNPEIAHLVRAHAERLERAREVLVLGDYAPKNLIASADGVFVIDLEVAHLGDPAFDVAFLLTHLVLKQLVLPERSGDLLMLAEQFWSAYRLAAGPAAAPDDDVRVALGCLLLARVDGKSPVEYLGVHGPSVREMAKYALLESDESVPALLRSLLQPPRELR